MLKAKLLHEDFSTEDWHDWFEAAELNAPINLRGMRFSHTVTMLESVENHQGFALGRTTLVQDDIDRGLLVAPFDIKLKSQMSYHLVYPESHANDKKLQIIKSWLFEEAEKFQSNGNQNLF